MPKKDRTRPVSRDDSFKKLRALKCFNEVHERVVQGWSPSEIARFIQMDRGEYTEVSQISLMQTVNKFRASLPPGVLANRRMPKEMQRAIDEVGEGLDELKELTELYRLQMKRIHMDHDIEVRMKKTLSTMTNEVRVAKELLTAIGDLKMDLGINTRHLGQVEGEVEIKANSEVFGKESVREVMNDPEKRRKVLNIAERILALPARTAKARAEARPEEQEDMDAQEIALLGTDLPDPDDVEAALGLDDHDSKTDDEPSESEPVSGDE